jgi:hypothetical protein
MRPLRDRRILLITLPVALLATVVLLFVVGLGRGGRGELTRAASGASASSVGTPAASGTGSSSAGVGNGPSGKASPVSRVIQWLDEQAPLGGGASGPAEDAYYSLMDGHCAYVLRLSEDKGDEGLSGPEGTLYKGAALACLAAFEGRAELWPRAKLAFEKASRDRSVRICEDQAVYGLLQRLIDAHRMHPDARLVKRPGARRELVCPRLTKVTPDHGPAEGGYTVQLEGENLPKVVGVDFGFGNYYRKAVVEGGRHVVFTVPPMTKVVVIDREAYVSVDGSHGIQNIDDGVVFTYDPPVATTRASSTTTRPSTTTTTQVTVPTSTSAEPPPSS